MSLNDLITDTRKDLLDDATAPYLWSDDQLKRFAFEALTEACKRAALIIRVSRLSVTATNAEYTLDDTVRQILTAKLDLDTNPLTQTTDAELSVYVGSHWRNSNGTPTHYVRTGRILRLYRNPIVNDTLVLVHSALPDTEYDIEEVNPVYYGGIGSYIAYLAYKFPDADTKDDAKAERHLKDFNDYFGLPKSAKFDVVSQNTPMYGSIIGGRMA